MEIFVDADGCPVVEDVIELAGDHQVHVIHNRHHQIEHDGDTVDTIETGDRADEADHFIYNHLTPGDVVVTDDLGLGALVLGRDATVIRFRGEVLDEDQIEQRLSMRHYSAKARRDNDHRGGPPAYSNQDRSRFREVLKTQLEQSDESNE